MNRGKCSDFQYQPNISVLDYLIISGKLENGGSGNI